MMDEPTACTSTGKVLGLGPVAAPELYEALDWLFARQPEVEKRLARKHLKGGCLVLYDVSSSYVEGRCCELARFGYNRDRKKGKLQIVYGLLCAADGCPVAIEVFEGNTGDPKTLAAQIGKLKQRFKLDRVVLVSDRSMITDARIREELEPAGLDSITALRAPAIQALAADDGPLQCRCSTRGIWPKSARLTFRVNGWWSAATVNWPPNVRGSAANSSMPRRKTSPSSRRPWTASAIPYADRTKLAWP